jgi:ornithine decarboxylase
LEKKPNIQEISKVISPLLDELFDKNVKFISEPGRYFSTSSHTLICNLNCKKVNFENDEDKKNFIYYINDGIYHSFNNILFDHYKLDLIPFSTQRSFENQKVFPTKIFGPTCDRFFLFNFFKALTLFRKIIFYRI